MKSSLFKTFCGTLFTLLALFWPFSGHAQNSKTYQNDVDSARLYQEDHHYEKALVCYKRSFKKKNIDLYDYYNASCCASLTGNLGEASEFLSKSIAQGYLNREWMEEDADLAALRLDPRWMRIRKNMDDALKNIEKKFSKIEKVNATDLIPFQENSRWGYMDRATMKVVVAPEFWKLTFMGDCATFYYKDDGKIQLGRDGKIRKVTYSNTGPAIGTADPDPIRFADPAPISGFKGFMLDSFDKVVAFSDIYNRSETPSFNISEPFKINGEFYLIAHKPERSGIIAKDGTPLPHFDFVHTNLSRNTRVTGDLKWFYFTDTNNEKGFINERGEVKLKGELLDYPFHRYDATWVTVQHGDDDRRGVLDLRKMEWIIKPQSLRIVGINYSYKGDCVPWPRESDIVEFYFLVDPTIENDGTSRYYIDKNMTEFRPKK
ncbi:TPR end-of-group domain-containing protein [Chryseolinea soli]|uniref:Tetratricopeptide repeat protein n=1 Tax=Chryseolinea soli TaxID=2321403 RepID=A0A385SL97_9BACT|nr:hypothetical protein [Chryseolinea soli]AYB31256.1 hypothetical protein D4L85_11985 [Chryseolinea soli]